jgi:cation diffusion facilitator CzcD-associated flavoprotein CzcO
VEPVTPALPGLDRFAGPVFHSARWDHTAELAGRRVAVVGTGASAIQLVPELARTAARLHVLQRTAPWVLPRPDRAITAWERRLFAAVPGVQRLLRLRSYWLRELLVPGVSRQAGRLRVLRRVALLHLRGQVRDPALRAALTPDYAIGCKRILVSSDYFPALQRPHVELVTAPVRQVDRDGLVTADGVRRPLDAIVLATGFEVRPPPVSRLVRGAAGRSLAETWGDSPQAYLGSTVAGFPNLFLLVGPNSVGGLSSVVFTIESQLRYVLDALDLLDRHRLAAVDVRPEVQDAFNAELHAGMAHSVWTAGGCASYYLDAAGRNTALWPTYTWRFRQLTRRFDLESYQLIPERAAKFGGVGTGPP